MAISVRFVSRCVSAAAVLAALAGTASADIITGPSSSQTPYLTPTAPGVNVISIITTGDSVNNKDDGSPYRMVGIPDGIGAFDNGDGTATILVNHELATSSAAFPGKQGTQRAHQTGVGNDFGGGFVSKWIVRTTPGANFLQVNHGQDLNQSYVTSTSGPSSSVADGSGTSASVFSRFCSGDLAAPTAFYNPATSTGTQERIYMNGEEAGAGSRAFANVVSERKAYQLDKFNGLNISFENLLANPAPQNLTIVNTNSDGSIVNDGSGTNGNGGNDSRVFTYVGTKTNSGSAIDRAGLTNGQTYGIQVQVPNGSGGFTNVVAENRNFGLASSGAPVYSGVFSLASTAGGSTGTNFLRPEDGAWNPANPREYFFVTTDQLDQVSDGVGARVGHSRLWKMTYTDISNPTAGGTIQAVLTGTEGQNMFDNITVVPGTDGVTRVLLCEDVGNAAHNGKVWMYDTSTGALTMLLQHDQARFGNVGVLATAPFTQDEESSGIVDARDTLGLGWFYIDVQAHYTISGELAEGGQLLAFYAPQALPTPGAAVLLGVAGLRAARRRRA